MYLSNKNAGIGHQTLIFLQGQNFDSVLPREVTISVGDESCNITAVTPSVSDNLLCSLELHFEQTSYQTLTQKHLIVADKFDSDSLPNQKNHLPMPQPLEK